MRWPVHPSFWLSLFFVAVIAAAVATAARWPLDTRLFPWAIGIPALALALCQLVSDFRARGDAAEQGEIHPAGVVDIPADRSIPSDVMIRRTFRGIAWILGFALGIWFFGFLVAIPIFVFAYLMYEARARVFTAVLLTGLVLLFVWGLFDRVMHLAWPEPLVVRMLKG